LDVTSAGGGADRMGHGAGQPTERLDAPPTLRTIGLGKCYGASAVALAGLDLDIRGGIATALLGPNGAGKSTLLKTWVGFERPSRGRVEVAGIDPWRHRAEALAHVAYIDQSPGLYRELTVLDHVALAGTLRANFDGALAIARLEELGVALNAIVGGLSGGEKAQVALSIALGTRAEILLLDEPLAHLDPLARREFLTVVRQVVSSEATTVVLASHLVTDVEEACDQIVLLAHGRKLIDLPIAAAIAGHAIGQTRSMLDERVVGRFRGPSGEDFTLIEGEPNGAQRSPTLEELVLGYSAAARPASSEPP
jgi:ABC-2 type transport system ATP-binding protein